MAGMRNFFGGRGLFVKNKLKTHLNKSKTFVKRKPLLSVFLLLFALFVLILLGSIIRKPSSETEAEPTLRVVETYSIGEVPTAQFQAQIEKSGIVKIVAINGGVVSKVHVEAGQMVNRGATLISLSSNYGGGNSLSIQRQLANTSYTNAKQTKELQKDIISKQKEIAEKTDANQDELREITSNSLDASRTLLDFNRGILDSLEDTLSTLEQNPNDNSDLILSTKQMISQFRSGVNQLSLGVEQSEYQSGSSNPPSVISDLTRETTLKQLELQEKNLELAIETSRLQLQLAQVNEASMYPSAPFSGIVERVHVKEGVYVNPGTTLITFHGEQTVQAIVKLPRDIALQVSRIEPSKFSIGDTSYEAIPFYISNEATDGSLYSAQFLIPDNFQDDVAHLSHIPVEIPLGYPDTGATIPFIPIETVFQTQNGDFVFVLEDGKVKSTEIVLGVVSGSYVEVISGISTGDEIILNRDVINGQSVVTE